MDNTLGMNAFCVCKHGQALSQQPESVVLLNNNRSITSHLKQPKVKMIVVPVGYPNFKDSDRMALLG